MLAANRSSPQDANGGGAIPLGVAAPDDDFVNIGIAQSSSAEKNCSACTMLNPASAFACSICGGTDFDN